MIKIKEIIDRSDQGVTKPFICRGDDDQIYFVKGRGAGRRGLICEWIAGNLAINLGLPIAPFAIVDVPEALISLRSRDDLSELGTGLAFGSRRLQVSELSFAHIDQVPDTTQLMVLAFDWWIKNGDRNLSEKGGNPNLFWDINNDRLVVLDHNQAFDPNFSSANLFELHPFRRCCQSLFGDWIIQQQISEKFEKAMDKWNEICDTVPDEWWFLDPEMTLPSPFDRSGIEKDLSGVLGLNFGSLL